MVSILSETVLFCEMTMRSVMALSLEVTHSALMQMTHLRPTHANWRGHTKCGVGAAQSFAFASL